MLWKMEMGLHHQDPVFNVSIKLLIISLLFSIKLLPFFAQGLPISQHNNDALKVKGEKLIVRELIGSRPPRCEGKCRNCGHCEAIQVPVVPQQGYPRRHFAHSAPTIAYSRGDALSDYKPMSWKCKCGNTLFNP